MKSILALILSICASLLLVFCENWPYKPNQFIAPVPPPPENAFVSKDSLSAFVGTLNVKLAYTKSIPGGNQLLYFVDFRDSLVAPKLLKKPGGKQDWSANCPILSPDGKLVAYYLTDPLNSKHAVAYCQKLDTNAEPNLIDDPGSDPHFYKDNQNLYIIYTDTTDKLDATYSDLKTRHTYKVQIDTATGQLKPGIKDTIAAFPFCGGMSYDGKYICTGYANAYIFNTVSKNFFSINPGKQTCNPSMTPDTQHTGQMMFLNIGDVQAMNSMPASMQGVTLKEHKFIFIADTNNNYVNSFSITDMVPGMAGASGCEWQCPKWSNVTDFFCALTSPTGSEAWDCYIISISNKALLKLNKSSLLSFDGASKPCVHIGGN